MPLFASCKHPDFECDKPSAKASEMSAGKVTFNIECQSGGGNNELHFFITFIKKGIKGKKGKWVVNHVDFSSMR